MLTHTVIIIAITTIVSFICFSNRQLQGQDGTHLLFNMFTLFFFGPVIEQYYNHFLGSFGFALFYLLALVVSIIPTYLSNINNPAYAGLGASGAVSAVLFAYILLAPWSMLYIFGVIPIPAIVFAAGYVFYSIRSQKRANDNINHSAHLWGAAFGVAATIALEPQVISFFIEQLLHPKF